MPDKELTNLLKETLAVMERNGLNPDNVDHVSYSGGWCDWKAFAAAAARINYDRGFGAQYVNARLSIVGHGGGWWLDRHEYDGRENWVYHAPPLRLAAPPRPPEVSDLLEDRHGCPGGVVIDGEPVDLVPAPVGEFTVVDTIRRVSMLQRGLDWAHARGSLVDTMCGEWGEINSKARGDGLPILPLRVLVRPVDGNQYRLEAEIEGVVEAASASVAALSGPETRNRILHDLHMNMLRAYSSHVLRELRAGGRAREFHVPAEDVPAIKDHFDSVVRKSRRPTQEDL